MAVLLMAILAIGAVSAESIDDADASIAIDDGDSGIELSDSPAEDVSTLSTVDDSTVAADEDVENILGDERPSYDLNDDTYSTYFNDDGTAKDILVPGDQAGDYDLVIGTLNDKKIIIDYGSQINIVAKEGEGIINNGTIIIGDDYGNAGSVFISGLTFNNYNKDGIDVREGSTDIQIDNNKFNLEYDSTFGNTSIAIATHGFVSGVSITNNVITMKSDVMYTYGIDLIHYLSIDPSVAGMDAAEDFNVSDNTIIIDSTAQTGMAEGMYLDTLTGSIFENNIIKISTMGACANYGIQLADSYAFFDFDNWAPSPYDVTIKGNDISLKSTDMAYGITVISIYGWGPNMEDDWIKDMVIADNTVNIESQKGAIGIGAKSSDVEITNNNVFVIANAEAINGAYPDGEFGDETAVITLVTFDPNMGAVDYDYSNITVTGNTITTNVAPFNITKNDTGNQPLVVEDNSIKTITEIDDNNYATYFNEDGTIKDGAPISANDIIVLGELNNKKFVIDVPLTIKGNGNKLTNTTISLVTGADGTTVSGLDMYYEDDGSAVFAIIAVNNGVSDVVIADNTITTVSASSWNYDMAISVYGAPVGSKNITISSNTITMSGDAGGLYAIDVQNYDPYWTKGQGTTGLTITDNNLIISGSGMVEPIYISNCNDILLDGNVIMSSASGGDAYGIGTSTNNNFTVTNNMILVASQNNMAYGVASPDSKDVVIDNNNITASGVGAIGIGFVNDENVEVDGNTITIYGGDYTTVSTYEKIGTGNAAILDKSGNTGVVIGENTITENCPLTIDDSNYATYFNNDGTIKDDAPISANDLILLGNLTNKKLVIDVPLTIKGIKNMKLTNTTIDLVTGADGTTIRGLDMYYEDDGSAVFAVIAVNNGVSDVVIADNTITTVSAPSWNYDMAISVYGSEDGSKNIAITGNTITMSGDAGGLYAIDVQNYDPFWNKGKGTTGLTIKDNIISISSSGMVEPIYVSNCNDILVEGNTITSSTTGGDAYGIGTASNNNITFRYNEIDVSSQNNIAYGITSTLSNDVVIDENTITSTGVAAVGVGIQNDKGVEINGNTISITGEDYTLINTFDSLGPANAAILNKQESNTDLVIGENTLTENGEATTEIKVGTGAEELQKLIDNAAPGSTIDLGDKTFYKVSDVVIDKDLTITGGNIVGEPGKDIFVVAPKSAGGPNEVNITDVNFKVNNATTIVQATADNATNPTAIDVASINIKNNNIKLASEDVVAESVTVLELDSERGVLAPTGEIAVSGNDLPAGVDPFDFKVTSIATDDGVVIPDGPLNTERTETEIIYQNMTTTAVDVDTDGRIGKYFYITLQDKNGNLLKNKPVQIGFNGVVYDRTTDNDGKARLQINLKNAGTYTFAVSYLGDDAYNGSFIVAKIVVNKQKGSLTVPNKSYKASASTKSLTATFKSASGKVVKGKKITFTVNGKSYSATTNAKGVATVKVSLNTKGTYSFTAKFAGNTMYAAISKKATLKIT